MRTLFLASFLILAACGGGGASSDGDHDGGSPGSGKHGDMAGPAAITLGTKYLLYYEQGGISGADTTPACGSIDPWYGSWTSLLAPVQLDIGTSLPASLDAYDVIALSFIGSAPGSTGLSAGQKQTLVDWMQAGGTAFFITDINYDDPSTNANMVLSALLASMNVGIQFSGDKDSPYYYSLALDQMQQLGKGVMPLGCGAVGYATITGSAIAVDAMPPGAGQAILATQTMGKGRVVVLSDSTCVSDYTNASGTPPQYTDCAVAPGAAASLGAFLHNLALP